MRRGEVVLDHHDGDEFGQVARVLRVLSHVEGDTLKLIKAAHDDKGTLHVSWCKTPGEPDMRRVEEAWEQENEYLLRYSFPDGQEYDVAVAVTERRPVA